MSKLSKVAQGPYAGWSPQTDPYLRRNPPQRPVSYNPDRNILPDLARNASTALRNVAALTLGLPGDFQDISRLKDAPRQLPNSEELAARFGGDITHPSWLPASFAAPGPGEVKQGLGLLSKVAGNVDPMWAMTLFHGTPHRFDKFSLDAIGSGEGAQAFGHGLYFAENPGVAKSYRSGLSRKQVQRDFLDALPEDADFDEVTELLGTGHFSADQERVIRALEKDDWLGFDYPSQAVDAAYSRNLSNWDPSDELRDAVKEVGHLYEVEIPDEITDRMLDWDAPLSEQPELMDRISDLVDDGTIQSSRVQEIVRGPKIAGGYYEGYEVQRAADVDLFEGDMFFSGTDDSYVLISPDGDFVRGFGGDIYSFDDAEDALSGLEDIIGESIERGGFGDATGKDLYEALQSDLGQGTPEAASRALNEVGIPGIRFYDGSSRAAGEGTRNIVVFNPDDITQVKRDGELVFEK